MIRELATLPPRPKIQIARKRVLKKNNNLKKRLVPSSLPLCCLVAWLPLLFPLFFTGIFHPGPSSAPFYKHTMASEPNQPFIDWENNEPKELSVAVSYEKETEMDPVAPPKHDEGVSNTRGDEAIDDLNHLLETENEPMMTDSLMESQPKAHQGDAAADANEDIQHSSTNNEGPVVDEEPTDENQIMKGVDGIQCSNTSETQAVIHSGKRRGRPQGSTDTRPRATKKSRPEECSWEDLVSQIRHKLGDMSSDECFVKAIELSAMARQQVESRSLHLLTAFDMLGKGPSVFPLDASSAAPAALNPLEQWMEKYLELKQFHHLNGHFNVPTDQPSYELLGKWVEHTKAHALSLNSTQLQLLGRIGFPLDTGGIVNKAYIDLTNNSPKIMATTLHNNANPRSSKLITKSQAIQGNKQISTQKPVKMHRPTRFRTIETVPCIKMAPPLPPNGDKIPSAIQAVIPVFQTLVNFPDSRHVGKCVMCDEGEYPIPNQNKGVCNNCDRAVWIYNATGLQIKWCKGCKNFRKWVDFGDKVRGVTLFVYLCT